MVVGAKEAGAVGVLEAQDPTLPQEISREDPSTENYMTRPLRRNQVEKMYNMFVIPTFTRFGILEDQMGAAEEDSGFRVLVPAMSRMGIKHIPQPILLRQVLTPQFNFLPRCVPQSNAQSQEETPIPAKSYQDWSSSNQAHTPFLATSAGYDKRRVKASFVDVPSSPSALFRLRYANSQGMEFLSHWLELVKLTSADARRIIYS